MRESQSIRLLGHISVQYLYIATMHMGRVDVEFWGRTQSEYIDRMAVKRDVS